MIAIPLNGANIYMASAVAGISVEELEEKKREAQREFEEKNKREWIINFFKKDEEWYTQTLEKIEEINQTLEENLHHKEKIKKMYGWIEPQLKLLVFGQDLKDRAYCHASCVKTIFNNPDTYVKMLNFD